MVIERPPRSGPMLRHDMPLRISGAIDDAGCDACGDRAATRSVRTPAANITPIASPRGRTRKGRRDMPEEFTPQKTRNNTKIWGTDAHGGTRTDLATDEHGRTQTTK